MFLQNSLNGQYLRARVERFLGCFGFFFKFLALCHLKVLFLCFHGSRKTSETVCRDIAAKICVICQSQRGEVLKTPVILMGIRNIWGLRPILRSGLKVPGAWCLLRWVEVYISDFSSVHF